MNRLTNKQILGVIDATTYIESLEPIIHNRSVASLPFGGRYRLIDFMLSNMVYAGIDCVGVFSHHQHNSLKEHIGSGKVWDLDRKNGGLFFYVQNKHEKFGAKSEIMRSMDFFLRSPHKYVVVGKCNVIGKIPFLEVLRRHRETEAEITELTYQGKDLGIYMVERELLLSLFEKHEEGNNDSIMGFMSRYAEGLNKKQYEVNGPLTVIDSLECYYSQTMNLLNLDTWKQVFPKQDPILTKAKDEPPTKYLPGSRVANAIIANGCVINGEVESSVLSRSVKIGKNTIVRNSIIMPKTIIGDNCVLDGVIVDKDVTISDGTHLEATNKIPIVVPKGATIQGELVSQ